jgi:hypothetical protein
MPITTATWDALRKRWLVELPGRIALEARTEADVAELVRRHASGSSIRYQRTVGGKP